MDYDVLFPGRFLKSGEFKGRDVTLTIRGIRTEPLPSDKGGEKVKGIVGFDGTPKELVLNRTNGECIKAMFGRETDEWIGKRVTFYPAPHVDNFTGEKGTAIRVRGSPDLAKATLDFELRLPRKKPMRMRLFNTAPKKNGNGAQKNTAQQPMPPPGPEPTPEEQFGFASEPPLSEPPDDIPLPTA